MEEKKIQWTDHLANQRTFLAWIRTNLGIMAFGFIVERFSLFSEQVRGFLQKEGVEGASSPSETHYSFILGISIIILGTILTLFAFFKYKKTEAQINENSYGSSLLVDVLLSLFVVLFGLSLIAYLILASLK